MNGYNENPTSQQFQSAYRKILLHSTVITSKKGNCLNFDVVSEPFSDILFVSSNIRSRSGGNEVEEALPEELDDLHEKLETIEALHQNNLIDPKWSDPTMIHIASVIEKRIKMADVYCEECLAAFDQNRKVGTRCFVSQYKPCHSTYIICKAVDRYVKSQFFRKKNKYKRNLLRNSRLLGY